MKMIFTFVRTVLQLFTVAARARAAFFVFATVALSISCVLVVPNVAVAQEASVKVQRPKTPVMKVMIGEALHPTEFTASSDFVVEDQQKTMIHSFAAGTIVRISYNNGVYSLAYDGQDAAVRSTVPLQVTPVIRTALVEVKNFENRPAWNTALNDNIFYHTVRVVYSPKYQTAVLVNEVGLERYVEGIAETGGETNSDYIRALLTAARTYAYYNVLHCTKFPGEPYCLDSTANSQLYRGAGYSKRAPLVIEARKATRKQVILYDSEPIIAPYFSHSDGRTRAWSEVWNGSYAWAQSVEDPCCTGQTVYGHGVGMSGEGARYFANQGWRWKDILKYYYTGVEVKKGY